MADEPTIPQMVPQTCWVCGESIRLEECKVDEYGLPVHERCYLAKVTLSRKAQFSADSPVLRRIFRTVNQKPEK
jgi:hypothetical protein